MTAQAGPVGAGTGIVLALLIALGVAVGAELRDRSFHDPHELADTLGLPVLGIIPHGRA